MFKNNLKIAWRNLMKDRQFTFLNLLGLSTGLACTLLIYLWVHDEYQFDKFHEKDARLFQLMEHRKSAGQVTIADESSGMLGETLAGNMPEIEFAAAEAPAAWFQKFTLSVGEKNLKATGQYVGKDYLNIFSFKLIDGNPDKVLADISSMVISDELAMKLFNTTQNLIGKKVLFQHDLVFFISGVFEKVPVHSSEQFDFLLSFEYYKKIQPWVTSWDNTGPHNFVLLKVLIALCIGIPLSWWAMTQWLNGFAYRISINVNVFLIAGISIVTITLLTIGYQSFKAAFRNPVTSLRSE